MSDPGKQAFLKIYHENEGLSRGAHLVEKINKAVYGLIKKQSNSTAAKSGQLYHIGMKVPDIVNLDRKTTGHILERLIRDKVIAQIFMLLYNQDDKALKIQPCFIAHESEESDNLNLLYNETIMVSVSEIEVSLAASFASNREHIKQDLLKDLEFADQPEASAFASTLVEPFKVIHASKFDVLPVPELIQKTINDIEHELVKRGKLIRILNYGLLYYRDVEIFDRIEASIEIVNEKLLPKYQKRPGLKRVLAAIEIEEATYKLDEHAPHTAIYDIKRAEALKKEILASSGKSGGTTRFPGSLAVEILLACGKHAEGIYQKKQKFKNLEQYEKLKFNLIHAGNDWKAAILSISEHERLKIARESWQSLVDDLELFYRTWELPDTTMHVFLKRDEDAFRFLIKNMGVLSDEESWKILAMKTIIEENEAELPDLFSDRELISIYGNLLRGVYLNYIPFLYKFLMLFGLAFAKDAGFKIAKEKIIQNQDQLGSKNEEKNKALANELEVTRAETKKKLHIMGIANRIIEQLDLEYLDRTHIPTYSEIRTHLKEIEIREFESAIEKTGFVIVNIGQSTRQNDQILLYPVDSSWHSRKIKLKQIVDTILQTEGIEAARPDQFSRARVLKKYLGKVDAVPVIEEEHSEDPYLKFGEEVEKVKQKELLGKQSP